MAKKAVFKIIGTQRLGRDSDKIELTTVGTLEETEKSYILRYKEEQEDIPQPISTKLTIDKDEKKVELMRSGPFGSLLIIERSKRNLCNYGSPFGDMLMGIFGKGIENNYQGKTGTFTFSYDIDVNGALTSQNEVKVQFRSLRK